jgi:hypothetical protein
MSHTSLYIITADGEIESYAEYRNSHGSAPQVWDILGERYLSDYHPHGTQYDPAIHRVWINDRSVLADLFRLANSGGMEDFERRTLWTTDDNVLVRIEDVPAYADAMAKFAEVYGPQRPGEVFSIGQQAEDLRRVYAELEAKGWRGVGWNQTSVGESFTSQPASPAQLADAFIDALIEAGLIPMPKAPDQRFELPIDKLTEAAVSWAQELVDEGTCVDYNVDQHTEHEWLPRAGESTRAPKATGDQAGG